MQQQAMAWRAARRRVVLVPTMGALHAGHLSLISHARRNAGPDGAVVVSVYVNPTQFNDPADLKAYPRTLMADKRHCRAEGADVVFAPKTIFEKDASVMVVEDELSGRFEGEHRPGHFAGVLTVVAKLFQLVQPHEAVFGEKDFQQATLIRRMIRDLNFPVRLILAPTVREPDGLAMSSRNIRLTPGQREQATVFPAAIHLARQSRGTSAGMLKRRLRRLLESQPDVSVDYVEVVDAKSLKPLGKAACGSRLLLAARVGDVRLIDNTAL